MMNSKILQGKEIHEDNKGRIWWLHKPSEFPMSPTKNSFIQEFGYCKEFSVLRVKMRKSKKCYQFFFVPLWVFMNLKRAEIRLHTGYVFRNWILKKYPYLKEN